MSEKQVVELEQREGNEPEQKQVQEIEPEQKQEVELELIHMKSIHYHTPQKMNARNDTDHKDRTCKTENEDANGKKSHTQQSQQKCSVIDSPYRSWALSGQLPSGQAHGRKRPSRHQQTHDWNWKRLLLMRCRPPAARSSPEDGLGVGRRPVVGCERGARGETTPNG